VHIPSAQTCCGGLHHQAGDSAGAAALDERNLETFSLFDNLSVLTVASGCGARLLEFMPQRVQDISAFLAEAQGWESVEIKPLQARIALHEPCTLRNVLKTTSAPYALLQRIPNAEILALPGNGQCCGGAGSYMLTQPEMADSLRDDKIAACIKLAPDYLVTSNIGCALHLANGLNEAGLKIKLVHPVMLLAKQMGFDGTL
jgi:glycolate oxidase iron-sulfur subunit